MPAGRSAATASQRKPAYFRSARCERVSGYKKSSLDAAARAKLFIITAYCKHLNVES